MTSPVAPARAGGTASGGTDADGQGPQGATTQCSETSHRERKKQATRQAIHEAAFELVDDLGLAQVTVEAISERAGVAPRTFWSYFGSKEEAVIDWYPDRTRVLREALLARPAGEDPLTAVRRVMEADMAARLTDPELAVRRQKLTRREPHLMAALAAIYDEMARALVDGVAERIGTHPEVDMLPDVVVFVVLGSCRVAHQRWADEGCHDPLSQLIDEAFANLTHALAPLVMDRRP